jgi:hypothetical protein
MALLEKTKILEERLAAMEDPVVQSLDVLALSQSFSPPFLQDHSRQSLLSSSLMCPCFSFYLSGF